MIKTRILDGQHM